jgi:hypothetical protein
VAGGLRSAALSLVRDDAWPGGFGLGRCRQLVVGPVTDRVARWPFPLEADLALAPGRFAVRHRPLNGQRNYAEALLKVPAAGRDSDGSAKVSAAKLIGQYFEEVAIVVGPVVGLVTAYTAVVVVEVWGP